MTTKERIVEEALTLFSVKGFKGTSVKNIADAVGIKDSSLYKHFKSKQEILDSIVETMNLRLEKMSEHVGLPAGDDVDTAVTFYAGLDEEQLVAFSKKIFLFYLKDSFVSRFWRMGTIEEFSNAAVYVVCSRLFLEESIRYQTEMFAAMVKAKVLKEADPGVLAMSFYAPIYFLLSKYSMHPEKEEEALQVLERQVREFFRIYGRE